MLLGYVCVGTVFGVAQFRSQGLYLPTNPNSSFFYVFTGVHVIHVVGGLGGLARVMLKFRSGYVRCGGARSTPHRITGISWGCCGFTCWFVLWMKL